MIRRSLFAAFFIGCVCFALAFVPKKQELKAEAKRNLAQEQGLSQGRPKDPPGTIDGQQQPDLIPNRAAYTVLFLVLADRNTAEERTTARAYLTRFDPGLSDSDLDGLISAASEYRQRVSVFDKQVKAIKDANWPRPDPAVFVKLKEFQTAKESLIDETASSLRLRLSPRGMNSIINQVLPHIKSRTKLAPEPRSLPGGEDWKPLRPHH